MISYMLARRLSGGPVRVFLADLPAISLADLTPSLAVPQLMDQKLFLNLIIPCSGSTEFAEVLLEGYNLVPPP
jgi:hypothetical protein